MQRGLAQKSEIIGVCPVWPESQESAQITNLSGIIPTLIVNIREN